MNHIRQLISVVRQYTSRRSPAWQFLFKQDTNHARLLQGIEDGEFEEDTQAMKTLFSTDAVGKRRYHSTKFLLTEKLETLFFFLRFRHPTVSLYTMSLYKVKREVFVAEILEWTGKHEAMIRIASRALKTADEYHFTHFQIRCNEMLRDYYSLVGKRKDFNRHQKALLHLMKINAAEFNASSLRARIKLELSSTLVVPPATVRDLQAELPELENDRQRFHTRSLELYYMRFAGAVKRMSGKLDEALDVYKAYLEFLNCHPQFDLPSHRFITNYHISRCHYFARNRESALNAIVTALRYEEAGTENWFTGVETQFLICLHLQDYPSAVELFKWTLAQPRFRRSPLRREKWSIYEAFLRFVLDDSETLPLDLTVRGSRFQLNYILEELTVTRLDRAGMYLAILMFQILHFLRRRLFDLLDSRIRTIQTLMFKIQRNREAAGGYYRADILVRMIVLMRNCDFHPGDTDCKTAKLVEHLIRCKQEESSGEFVMPLEEIIPYEHIWEFIRREIRTIEKEQAGARF